MRRHLRPILAMALLLASASSAGAQGARGLAAKAGIRGVANSAVQFFTQLLM
jgi:hypothetical protein